MINRNYLSLKDSYLFTEIAARVSAYQKAHPDAAVIRLGIGDVTLPLPAVCVEAMEKAVREMGDAATFRGYGPEQGYAFLREAVSAYYARTGVQVDPGEVLISDGAKSDLGNVLDIFDKSLTVLVPDPVYPVYVDTNLMDGRTILYARGSEENGFLPMPDEQVQADLIYLCSPNNPTGAVYSREQLEAWVAYARARGAVILYDAAYECFIEDDSPRSILSIPGARECAVEFCSFSKTAGFTGTRCGWTVVPDELVRDGVSLRRLWTRRQSTKFNGVSYPVQRAAEAALSPAGMEQCRKNIAYYKENARIIASVLDECGVPYTGGKNSPYIWLKCGADSWVFFDRLLNEAQVVGTPGAGFGKAGEGWFRLTGFGNREKTAEAANRLRKLLK